MSVYARILSNQWAVGDVRQVLPFIVTCAPLTCSGRGCQTQLCFSVNNLWTRDQMFALLLFLPSLILNGIWMNAVGSNAHPLAPTVNATVSSTTRGRVIDWRYRVTNADLTPSWRVFTITFFFQRAATRLMKRNMMAIMVCCYCCRPMLL